jgi:hypothetical protein
VQVTKDIAITFKMEMTIADPNQHKDLFVAANKVEMGDSVSNDVIIDKLSVLSGSVASSVANLSVADGSVANPSIMNFSMVN